MNYTITCLNIHPLEANAPVNEDIACAIHCYEESLIRLQQGWDTCPCRGAEICGNPLWLASALGKIARSASHVPNYDAERNPATAHMFIINPLTGAGVDNLFSTHPNTENRIAALQEIAPTSQTSRR